VITSIHVKTEEIPNALFQLEVDIQGETYISGNLSGEVTNTGWTTLFESKDLGGVLNIRNKTARVRVVSHKNPVLINKIRIGTDANFEPDIECDHPFAATVGEASRWAECKRILGLKKIKIHTSNEEHSGTDDAVTLRIRIPRNETDYECTTGSLENTREEGRTEDFVGQFGDCSTYEVGKALDEMDEDKPIQVEIRKDAYYHADDWTLDLLKLYFKYRNDDEMVFSCLLCHNTTDTTHPEYCGIGYGSMVKGDTKTHNCYVMKSSPRSLERIRVKACNLYWAGSDTQTMKLKICQMFGDNTKSNCCTTNMFEAGGVYLDKWMSVDNGTAADDGGDQLGQCEGFPISGTRANISLLNSDSDAICLEKYEFFGTDIGQKSVSDLPFIKCNPTCKMWGDSEEGYCEGDADWQSWRDVTASCEFVEHRATVKKLSLKICDDEGSGTTSAIHAIIQNTDNENCTTDVLTPNKFEAGSFEESSDIGSECLKLPINENLAKVWIVNMDSQNSLCLTDVFLDIANASTGTTKILKCGMREDVNDFKIYALEREAVGIPLVCK